eukprot:7368163-Pyramimonas_sp.AAC.1
MQISLLSQRSRGGPADNALGLMRIMEGATSSAGSAAHTAHAGPRGTTETGPAASEPTGSDGGQPT